MLYAEELGGICWIWSSGTESATAHGLFGLEETKLAFERFSSAPENAVACLWRY